MSKKFDFKIQVITMSATLSNIELLKRWLHAELFVTHFRPVALQEMIKVGNKIYDANMKIIRDLSDPRENEKFGTFSALQHDNDHVAQLCIETLLEGCSVLVFCPSKDWCENLALQLAAAIHTIRKNNDALREQIQRAEIDDVKKQLRDIPTGLDQILEKTITYACAFHHAGLTAEERDIIEASFKSGALKIIVATSTLSSGVNLPARRVLIRSPLFGGKQMNSLTYKQMIGRAGRTGKDILGESILICTESNARAGRDLVTAELKPICSCLEMDSSTHLKRALLEVISSGVATSLNEIVLFVNCTLLNAEKQINTSKSQSGTEIDYILEALKFLIDNEFVRVQRNEENQDQYYIATRLGMACLASSMPPTDGLILFAELQKSRRSFVLESDLHAVYLVTPYSVCYQLKELDWLLFLDLWEKLSPAMKKVGEIVGVKESFLVRAMRGQTNLDYKLKQVHKRFYTALALQELVNETPIVQVANKYKLSRGMLQGLQQMASTFAGIVTAFCNSLQWSTMSLVVSQFKERLFFGVHRDLIDLMRLPDLNQKRARVLFDGGITTLVGLGNADVFTVEKLLSNSLGFDSAKQRENENEYEVKQRNMVRNFFITGKKGITIAEAAKFLISEARRFVQYELGVGNINWSHKSNIVVNGNTMLSNEDNLMSCDDVKLENSQKSAIKRKSDENISETTVDGSTKLEKLPYKCETNACEMPSTSKKALNLFEKNHADKELIKSFKPLKLSSKTVGETISNQEITGICDSNKPGQKDINILDGEINGNLKTKYTTAINKENSPVSPIKNRMQIKCKERINVNEREVLGPNNVSHLTTKILKYTPTQIQENLSVKQNSESSITFKTESIKGFSDKINFKSKKLNQNGKLTPNAYNQHKQTLKQQVQPTRRSPRINLRNNASNNGKMQTYQNHEINDMFLQDSSFELNSGINAALDSAEKLNATGTCGTSNEKFIPEAHNISNNDEIPNSQQMDDFNNTSSPSTFSTKTNIPQKSRLLRSYRTPILKSPLRTLQKEKEDKPSISLKESFNTGNIIEVSDVSTDICLLKNPIHLNASHILSCSKEENVASSFESLEIIDICGNLQLFKNAFKEISETKNVGFCVGLQRLSSKDKPLIGTNLLINQVAGAEETANNGRPQYPLFQINDVTYLTGVAFAIAENVIYFMNMQEEGTCKGLTSELKSKYLCMIFKATGKTLHMFETKEQLKILRKCIPELTVISVNLEDPKIANWLLQPDKTMTLLQMTQQFAPECVGLAKLCGTATGYNSFGLDAKNAILAKVRCSVEACVTMHILKGQSENMKRIGDGQLQKFFSELEMPLQLSLCNMELFGFAANELALQKLYQKMVESLKKLETKIYDMHGSRFNLGSSSAVARVLGLHRKTNGRISTSRQILEKIDSPISQLIITYRKLSVTLSKNIQPLLKSVHNNRIHGQSITFTSTGRISMTEPNLQNVAKDFELDLIGVEKFTISCRSAFFPVNKKRCLISADFCQLEMRILAHLSQDPSLVQVMKTDNDLFRAIAADWNKISEKNVTEQLRNGTKQICYGIVYGMGVRSLADALKCSEHEAAQVSEQFHAAYPGIRSYAEKVIKFARNNGYIETITGRRRYLDHINSNESQRKNQAERQAVNSAIQGSAADIAKNAIIRLEKNIAKYSQKLGLNDNSVNFVLHLHDELIFEVPEEKANKISKIIGITMENCVKLNVPLRVKLKIGKSWGELNEVQL